MTLPSDVHKRPPRRPVTYDINVVGRLDRVTAPKQQRSEQRLQRVLGALESLLRTKAFAAIYIPEIAAKAGCSAATIYGRFKDKDSILAALHESLSEQMIFAVDHELDPQRWEGKTLHALATHYCTTTVTFYRQNRNLLAGVLLIHDQEVYERAASAVQHVSERFAAAARVTETGRSQGDLAATHVDLAIRSVFALLQQRLLFYPVKLTHHNDGSDEAFSSELAQMLVTFCTR